MATLESLYTGIYNKFDSWTTYDLDISMVELEYIKKSSITFPRLEIVPVKFKGEGYLEQRAIEYSCYFKITGYLQKDIPDGQTDSEWCLQDTININLFGMRTMNRLYTLLDDKQAGTWVCPGLLQFDGFPEVWTNFELATPGRSSFTSAFIAKILLTDTEE